MMPVPLVLWLEILEIPWSGTLQGGRLTLRLASACALQGNRAVLAQHVLRRPIRPVLVLGCRTLWGPLGVALGFYRAQVRCLNVALFGSNDKLEAIKHGRGSHRISLAMLPLLCPGLRQRDRAASSVRDTVWHHAAQVHI
jgi:hypothetical protein